MVVVRADARRDRLRRRARRSQPNRRPGCLLRSRPGIVRGGRWPRRLPPAPEPDRLVLYRKRRLLRVAVVRAPVRLLRARDRPRLAARGGGDGLGAGLDLGAGGHAAALLPAALLPGWAPDLPSLEVGSGFLSAGLLSPDDPVGVAAGR